MNEINLLKQAKTDQIKKIVVGAVILYDNKCLCVKRAANDFMAGLIELPSGGVDEEESLEKALFREIQEETGITLLESQEIKYISSFDYISGSGKKTRQFNYVIGLNQKPNIVLNPQEHSEYFWLSKDDLNNPNFNLSDEMKEVILAGFVSER